MSIFFAIANILVFSIFGSQEIQFGIVRQKPTKELDRYTQVVANS